MTAQATLLAPTHTALAGEIETHFGTQTTLCYQCKKCTSGCPVADVMDFRPHQIVRLTQLGGAERLLTSEAIWTCVGCYLCTTRCPQGVPVAELMYTLKSLALKQGITPKQANVPAFYRAFERTVEQNGRNSELWLIARFFLATDLRAALKESTMGIKLFLQGRLPLMAHKVRDRKAVRRLLRKARSTEGKP